ncbi:MAG: hypothetical protein H6737_28265 [Alphaproteobacteria bacterium]|nr:hypothetical protein [Alphaproteobacteria bacterium]
MSNQTNAAVIAIAAAVAVGAGVFGLAAGWMMRTPEEKIVEVTRAPTAEEIAAAVPQEEKDELALAQIKVAELERESAEKEGRVRELEDRISRGAEAGAKLRAELERVKSELEETKAALAQAEEEKEELLVALKETTMQLERTEQELAVTKVQRDDAREDALFNRWNDFVKGAELEICDRGNRRKLGNCREAVTAALTTPERRDKFSHCIRSGQAAPSVVELQKGAELPDFAEMMDEEVKQVKGWFVNYCDPTLPERNDIPLANQRLPKATPTATAPVEPAPSAASSEEG